MRGRIWLSYFTRIAGPKYKNFIEQHPNETRFKFSEWTEVMRDIMDGVGKKINCRVARRRRDESEFSGEYLNIDVFFIDEAEYVLIEDNKGDPFVLPRAVVELENSYKPDKISYCLWKILCIRAPIRVLICYQQGEDKVIALKQRLEDIIWHGSLMKGTDGDLLVIIGDENVLGEASCGKYFTVFEWRNDRLEKIEGLEW